MEDFAAAMSMILFVGYLDPDFCECIGDYKQAEYVTKTLKVVDDQAGR